MLGMEINRVGEVVLTERNPEIALEHLRPRLGSLGSPLSKLHYALIAPVGCFCGIPSLWHLEQTVGHQDRIVITATRDFPVVCCLGLYFVYSTMCVLDTGSEHLTSGSSPKEARSRCQIDL